MDLPKIYALVEQMLKAEDVCTRQAFDMPNAAFETPLYLAVQKNSPEVVAYLIEAGANPNHKTALPVQETPLHCAASNGTTEIVEVISFVLLKDYAFITICHPLQIFFFSTEFDSKLLGITSWVQLLFYGSVIAITKELL